MTSVLSYGVRLTLVLGHAGVDVPVLLLAHIPFFPARSVVLESEFSYWTMSARMGALKTLGRGWVFWLAAPSAPMIVTVGRDILVDSVCSCVSIKQSSTPRAFRKFDVGHFAMAANLWECLCTPSARTAPHLASSAFRLLDLP